MNPSKQRGILGQVACLCDGGRVLSLCLCGGFPRCYCSRAWRRELAVIVGQPVSLVCSRKRSACPGRGPCNRSSSPAATATAPSAT